MNRSISKGRNALVMGLALITTSLLLIASFANASIVGLALQNTETPTSTVEATTEPTTEATAEASATPATVDVTAVPAATGAVGACVDAMVPSTDATATDAATEDSTATTEATVEATAVSPEATVATGPTSYLGVVVTAVSDCGVRVLEVFADSPAFAGELAVGDVIVAVNGVPLTELTATQSAMGSMNYASVTTAGFFAALHALPPGTVVTLTVQRADGNVDLTVTLSELAAGAPSIDFEGTLQPAADGTSTPDAEATVEPALEATP